MPGSSEKGKPAIRDWFQNISDKKTVLDVGPGWGTYSKLLRKPGQVWHAVEIHEPYIDRFCLEQLYDEVFIADIRTFTPPICYDVVICGDVLEHMVNDEAVLVIKNLLKYANHLIVSLPLDAETNAPPGTGDVDWNNPYELHRGKWSHQLFTDAIAALNANIFDFQRFTEIAVYLIGAGKTEKAPGA